MVSFKASFYELIFLAITRICEYDSSQKGRFEGSYTQYRGLAQVTNWVKLKFVAMNLKKLARWLWREKLFPFISILLCTLCTRNPAYT